MLVSLRSYLKEQRVKALSSENEVALRHFLFDFCLHSQRKKWGLVWPIRGEADLRPLCYALFEKGFEIFLPQTFPETSQLFFKTWHPHCKMEEGPFGTWHPQGERDESYKLEGVIVPLLGYDSQGNRIGYGGGFYDRFLAKYPKIFRLGYGFTLQHSEALDCQVHDQRLDGLCTEKGIITFPARNDKI
ncbi:5-formyltetrahydrofolate cyclo-ligase [Acetobacteraceae bacterium]|nr:5-formyltetrahydrofolate cyclo-ligase [Acetobacteraceae bacterium]